MKTKLLSTVLAIVLCLSISGCSLTGGTGSASELTSDNTYNVLRCEEQGFSVLYRAEYTGIAQKDRVSIYPDKDTELNRVDIRVMYDSDTAGWDAGDYFYYLPEDMEAEDGIKYAVAEEYKKDSYENFVLHGSVFSYETEDGAAYRYEMVVDMGSRLVGYSCYFYEGEQDEPIAAMTDAIKSFQPDANYYDSHPQVIGDGGQTQVIPQQPQATPQQPQNPDVSTLGGYQIEAAKPIVSDTVKYDGGGFSLELPEGWQIGTVGDYTAFSFYAFDPQQPERRIFFFCKLEPFLKSEAAKAERQAIADMVGPNDAYGYNVFAAMPVLSPATVEEFLMQYPNMLAATREYAAYCIPYNYPDMNNIQVLETGPCSMPSGPACLDNSVARVVFTSGGRECQGLVAAQVTDKVSAAGMTGADIGFYCVYDFMGVSAPAEEFPELEETLLKCLSTFTFTAEYLEETRQAVSDETEAVLAQARSMQAAYDSYNAAWSARQTSYDIISQKNSDATLGYDRLYDSSTGEVYRAELGFYDSYDTNRDKYSNPNLQIIDGSSENYYLSGVDYYIYK